MAAANAGMDSPAAKPSLPGLVLTGRDLAPAKALLYVGLASAWVAVAGVAAAVSADLAFTSRSWDVVFPVVFPLLSTIAVIFAALFAVVALLLGLRAATRTTALIISMEMEPQKISGVSVWNMLCEAVVPVVGSLAGLLLAFLGIAGCLMAMMGLLPVEESHRLTVARVIVDVGLLGSMAMFGLVVIPSLVLKIWRMNLGAEGDSAASNIV
ncbi:hypothetical protein ACP70R_047577 [Stipagrostis hirtigluma subsp. patula]